MIMITFGSGGGLLQSVTEKERKMFLLTYLPLTQKYWVRKECDSVWERRHGPETDCGDLLNWWFSLSA